MGLLEAVRSAVEPLTVELQAVLEDGERAAVKCRPLISVDYFGMTASGFDAIPVLTGAKRSDDLSVKERMQMYSWMREVVAKSIVAIRDVEDGKSVWRDAECIIGDLDPTEIQVAGNGKFQLSVRMIENLNGGEIVEVANAIISRTNVSTRKEWGKRRVRS